MTDAAINMLSTHNVRDFGAAGDGVRHDTAAFQQTLDAYKHHGGTVRRLPAGNTLCVWARHTSSSDRRTTAGWRRI